MSTREEFIKKAQASILDLVKKTHSYGELPFAMALENERGMFTLATIPGDFDDEASELGFIVAILEEAQPVRAAAIQGGHLSLRDNDFRFKEEAYIVHVVDWDGEQIVGAVVDRHVDGPPTVNRWITTDPVQVVENEDSVFIKPIRAAIKATILFKKGE